MAQQQMQQEVERMASLHELGALQREYRIRAGYLLFGLTLFYSILSFVIVVTLISIIKMDGLRAVLIALVASLGVYGLVTLFRSIHRKRHSRRFLYLYMHGLLAVRCQNQQIMASEAIHWRDVATIWHDVRRNEQGRSVPIHSYRLQRSDGAFFGQYVDGECEQAPCLGKVNQSLGEHIERMVHQYRWPLVLSAYEQGLPVEFGPLTLHVNGIQSPNGFLGWSWFEHFVEDNSEGLLFIIPKKGRFSSLKRFWVGVPVQGKKGLYLRPIYPWAVVPYAQVPNLALFLHLIQQSTTIE